MPVAAALFATLALLDVPVVAEGWWEFMLDAYLLRAGLMIVGAVVVALVVGVVMYVLKGGSKDRD